MVKLRKEKSAFRENAESIIIAIILAVVMRQFVVQAFKIPSGSMEQTLLIGDHILVNKFLYRFTDPEQFDVIVFKYPWEEKRDFIKRVIALPGDQILIRGQKVYVNDQLLQEPYAQYAPFRSRPETFGPLLIPKKGDEVEIRSDRRLYINGARVLIPSGRFYPRDHGAAMSGFEVFYGNLFPAGTTLQKPVKPFTVSHDYYLTLGDNRDNSKDSRYWGFVKSDRIKGKAFFIYWSWNRNGRMAQHVRWERLGRLLGLEPPGEVLAGD